MSAIIIIGNPVDGHRIIGPFDTDTEALEYAEYMDYAHNWWITDLDPPEPYFSGAKDCPLDECEHHQRADLGSGIGWVHVAKAGGGTVGREYDGYWMYAAENEDGEVFSHSDNDDPHSMLYTGTPKTHAQAADDVIVFMQDEIESALHELDGGR